MSGERRSQSITVSAKTVAEAIAEAERRLGLAAGEIDVTVLSEGSKGFLGIGGEHARILAMPKAILARRAPEPVGHAAAAPLPTAPAALPEPASIPSPSPEPRPLALRPIVERETKTSPPAAPSINVEARHDADVGHEPFSRASEMARRTADNHTADAGEEAEDEPTPPARVDSLLVAEVAVDVVRELLVRIGIDARATIRSTGNPVVIDIAGDDLGLLIGRHGDTLGSLQYLVNAIVGKRVHRWCKVIVDVEHYRQRREDTLRILANRQATRVRQTMQEIALDPMPAAERRVVHMTLQNSPWVVTSSVGDEPHRHVVIAPRPDAR